MRSLHKISKCYLIRACSTYFRGKYKHMLKGIIKIYKKLLSDLGKILKLLRVMIEYDTNYIKNIRKDLPKSINCFIDSGEGLNCE